MARLSSDGQRTFYPKKTYGVRFDGSTGSASSSSAIDLSSYNQLTLRFITSINRKITATNVAVEFSNNYNLYDTGFNFHFNIDGGFRATIRDNGYTQASTKTKLLIGKYYEFVVVMDKTQTGANIVKIYCDGKEDYYNVLPDSLASSNFGNFKLFLGARDNSSFYSPFDIHMFEIYAGVKSASEISALYGTNDTGSDAIYSWKNASRDKTKLSAVNGGVDITVTNGNALLIPPLQPRRFLKSFNNSLKCDGATVNAQVTHDSSLNVGTGDFWIESWFKVDESDNSRNQYIFSKRNPTSLVGYELVADMGTGFQDGKIACIFDDGKYSSIASPIKSFGQWNHVIVNIDRSSQDNSFMMVNGVIENSINNQVSWNGDGLTVDNTDSLYLGQRNGTGFFKGNIAYLNVSSGTITEDEALARWYDDTTIDALNIGTSKVRFAMTDSSGLSLTDSSGNGNNAILTVGATISTTEIPEKPRQIAGTRLGV